jgi:hypothetical protein
VTIDFFRRSNSRLAKPQISVADVRGSENSFEWAMKPLSLLYSRILRQEMPPAEVLAHRLHTLAMGGGKDPRLVSPCPPISSLPPGGDQNYLYDAKVRSAP